MINSLAFNKAVALYHQITDHNPNGYIAAKADTPVATLVAPIIAPALFYDENSEDYESVASIASLIERSSLPGTDVDAHHLTLSNFTQMAKGAVERTVHLTKSVALPVIDEIVVGAEARLNEVGAGAGLALNVIADTQSNILLNPTLISAIEPFQSVAGMDTQTVNVHDPRTPEQLVELIRVGYDDFDNEIQAWLGAHLSADIISNIYEKVFSVSSKTTYISNVFGNGPDSYPEALICFLLARGLTLSTDENINMSAADYDIAMALVSNYAAVTVQCGMLRYKSADKNDRVVMRYPPRGQELSFDRPEQGVIVVNQSSYERFLEQGGTPEVIMGSYLTDRQTDASRLLENRDQYITQYNARVLKARSDSRIRVITSMRRYLEEKVAAEIVATGNSVEEQGFWKGVTIDQAVAQSILRRCIDNMQLEDLDDMYSTVRDIILDVFFEETDVRKLIQLIDENSKDSPDDIQSAANLAIVDYIVDWFMHQTELCSK